MTSTDLELSMFLFRSVIPWLLTLVFVFLLYRYVRRSDSYLFTEIYARFLAHTKYIRLDKYKVKLFDDLGNFKSRDSQLRNQGSIRILEIGSGPGMNFKYYPKNCRLVCYEPNPFFQKYLFENHERYPEVNLERYVVAGGEKLVGTPDNSVDVVVSTLVHCSVNNVDQVLNEIQRVLAPGGRYYFLDHVVAPKSSSHYRIQTMMNPLWKRLTCDLQRDMEKALKKTSFTSLDFESFTSSVPFPFSYLIHDFVMGIATK